MRNDRAASVGQPSGIRKVGNWPLIIPFYLAYDAVLSVRHAPSVDRHKRSRKGIIHGNCLLSLCLRLPPNARTVTEALDLTQDCKYG